MEPSRSPYAGALAPLALALLNQEKWTEAESTLRECLTIREAKQPDDWITFNTKSMLGGALLGRKKYDDAQPLLVAGYEGMKQRADKIPPTGKIRRAEALDRLIELAEATGQPDEAKAWREEKARDAAAPPMPAPATTPNPPADRGGEAGGGQAMSGPAAGGRVLSAGLRRTPPAGRGQAQGRGGRPHPRRHGAGA